MLLVVHRTITRHHVAHFAQHKFYEKIQFQQKNIKTKSSSKIYTENLYLFETEFLNRVLAIHYISSFICIPNLNVSCLFVFFLYRSKSGWFEIFIIWLSQKGKRNIESETTTIESRKTGEFVQSKLVAYKLFQFVQDYSTKLKET